MMSKKRIVLIIFFALCFFIGLIIKSIPANWALSYAANLSNAFVPVQVSGTVWQGKASNIVIILGPKPLVLGKVSWDINAWSLLTGVLSLDIDARHDLQKISGEINLGLLQKNLSLVDFTVAFDAAEYSYLSPMPVNYEAYAELTLQRFAAENILQAPRIVDIAGNLLVKGLAVNFGTPINLGTYGLRLSTKEEKVNDEAVVLVNVSDVDAVVEVAGTAELLASTQAYALNMNVKPTAKASPLIMQTLSQFYKRQSDGSYQLSLGKAL